MKKALDKPRSRTLIIILMNHRDVLEQIQAYAANSVYRRGADYQKRGRVLSWWFAGTDRLEGKVEGSGGAVYETAIEFSDDYVMGECDCPYAYDQDDMCKHVVALALEYAAA